MQFPSLSTSYLLKTQTNVKGCATEKQNILNTIFLQKILFTMPLGHAIYFLYIFIILCSPNI
jgi:hypothetical protein